MAVVVIVLLLLLLLLSPAPPTTAGVTPITLDAWTIFWFAILLLLFLLVPFVVDFVVRVLFIAGVVVVFENDFELLWPVVYAFYWDISSFFYGDFKLSRKKEN